MKEEVLISNILKRFPIKNILIKNNSWEYICAGRGKETLVIFPGGGQSAQSNFELLEHLSHSYKVLAVTIYSVRTLDEFCASINTILDKEKIKQFHLYGLSLGGILAQVYFYGNQRRVKSLVLSHTCTAKSNVYKKHDIRPLRFLKFILPIIPTSLVKYFGKKYTGVVQGLNVSQVKSIKMKRTKKILSHYFAREFYEKYFNKTLLHTWINLHLEYFKRYRFEDKTYKNWPGKVLVIRTDNDPLMQDEGDFKRIYPNVKTVTFRGTGHVTFYYRSNEISELIKDFLKTKS